MKDKIWFFDYFAKKKKKKMARYYTYLVGDEEEQYRWINQVSAPKLLCGPDMDSLQSCIADSDASLQPTTKKSNKCLYR